MANISWSGRIKSGTREGNIQTTGAVVAAPSPTTRYYSLKSVFISADAIIEVTIEDDASTPNVLLSKIHVAAEGFVPMYFDPGEIPVATGQGVFAKADGTADVLVYVSVYEHGN